MKLNNLYRIDNFIDTFALGHYARVLSARSTESGRTVAFKVMRPEHLLADGEMRWEYRAFANEAEILSKLGASPHVVKLIDCGFVSTIGEAPSDGDIDSFGTNVKAFVEIMAEYAIKGWRPYLALEELPRNDNLFYLMRPSKSGMRRRLPTEEALTLALQFANLLKLSHAQKIVYLDHKLEHVYWDGMMLRVIDFNSSQQLKGNAGDFNEFAKDVHNLCVGVLYPIFTGMSPQKTTLRPQPGSLEEVQDRYSDVTELDFMMEPTLSQSIQDLLQRGASMQITSLEAFIDELEYVSAIHGRDFPRHNSTPSARMVRENIRDGLQKLRDGTAQIREARDILREALIIDSIPEELEDEIRRLVQQVNEQLNKRAIP